jgi:hypothetical protein
MYDINLEKTDTGYTDVFYMQYANPIPHLGINNVSFKLSFPYTSFHEWYVSFEYF